MANAYRDENSVPTLIAASSVDGKTPVRLYADPVTHRLLVDIAAGGGTVTDVSVATANGFAGTVADPTTTPEITIETTVTGITKGDGTALSAAVANTDYQIPITLTTTGTSGAATFDGETLNIPDYTSGNGDVVGPASATDNAVARYDTTTGKLIQNSVVLVSDTGAVTGVTDLTASAGVRVGFTGAPTNQTVEVGDINFGLDYGAGIIPAVEFDSGDLLSFARGTNTYNFLLANDPMFIVSNTAVTSGTDNTLSLGTASVNWSDLFLASGALINFANGNSVITHSSGVLTLNPGDLRITTPGTNAASVPTLQSTSTMTNKRITKRVVTVNAPGATPSTNTDNVDIAEFTGLNAAITSMTTNLTGTPVNGDMVEFIFLDNGTARAITWGASFADSGTVALPTTTVTSTALRVLVQWQTAGSVNKWVCIAVS